MKNIMSQNKKVVSVLESRHIMMEILKNVADFCDKNGIRYTLSYGTLIGAIRHQGFIPWDDDIDIDMPRPDYEKFIKSYPQTGPYKISAFGDKNSFLLYAKVYDSRTIKKEQGIDYVKYCPLGIDIDVFPIDGQPNDIKKFKRQNDRMRFLGHLMTIYTRPASNRKLLSNIADFFVKMIPYRFFSVIAKKISQEYSFGETDYVGYISHFNEDRYRNRHKLEIFKDRIQVKFEDSYFWAPIGYQEYLTNLYGDYMQLPPVEKRVTHHCNSAYWK